MTFNDITKIFLGIPPSESRQALSHFVLKNLKNIKKAVVPCAGGYAAISTIVNSGIKPENIICSDVSLYSSCLGYFFSGQNLADLNVQYHDKNLSFLETDKIQDILFAMKYAQLKKNDNYYYQQFTEEFLNSHTIYQTIFKKKVDYMALKLKGLTYQMKDIFQEIYDHEHDKDTIMFVNPPAYKDGYSKMFAIDNVISYTRPNIKEFDPALRYDLMFLLKDITPTVVLYHNIPDITVKNAMRGVDLLNKIFAKKFSDIRIDYLLTNKKITKDNHLKRPYDKIKGLDIPIFSDEDMLNKHTKITIMPIKKETAQYYRNLFIHKLPAKTSGEQHYLMLLDGKIFTVFALQFSTATKDGGTYLFETYGINRLERLIKERSPPLESPSKEKENNEK